jgi:hypothetical protein
LETVLGETVPQVLLLELAALVAVVVLITRLLVAVVLVVVVNMLEALELVLLVKEITVERPQEQLVRLAVVEKLKLVETVLQLAEKVEMVALT